MNQPTPDRALDDRDDRATASAEADAPVGAEHPTGEAQAAENRENESPS